MRNLPSGTVTFLFTDIEGSTRLLRELGGRYVEVLAEHRLVLREAFATHNGVEVDTQGDAFFYAFARASDAVAAALAGQRAFSEGPIRVRMGLHTGEPVVTDEGYVGIDVHKGARIGAAGHGGQVLLSQAASDLVDADFRDLGEHRLRDLEAPERIFQLGHGDFPPLKSLNQTNLPIAATPFLGRARELEEVDALLRAPELRLLTLTGTGGTGKTRLGIEAAGERVGDYEHGVWWVQLAPLRDPALVLESVAQTLGAKGELAEHIADKRMLLLLDNFEHLVEAGPSLAELIAQCANLNVLVTSREPLHLSAEREYAVLPLSEVEAIAMFCQCAIDAEPDEVVAEICRRLDCLPLAVELAAARTKVLSPPAILSRLEQRLAFLTGGPRDVPDRQRTLRATIAWSHELLAPEEQRLFARFSVFAGDCTFEAAEEVADADLDLLQALVDQSLLRVTGDRFWMLETIHEFALERLEEGGEEEELRRRHSDWFLGLAERIESGLRAPYLPLGLDRLAADQANFRSALRWMLARGEFELEVRLAASLQPFFEARGHFTEGRRWLEAGLQRTNDLPLAVRAKAVFGLGRFVDSQGDYAQAAALYTEASELCRATNDPIGVVQTLTELGWAERLRGDLERADALGCETVELARTLGDSWALAGALHGAALTAHQRGDRPRARALDEESLELRREIGDAPGMSISLVFLGWLNLLEGNLGLAATSFEEALSLARDVNDTESIAYALENLGVVALKLSDHERAAGHLVESLTLAAQMGDRRLVAGCLAGMAAVAAARGTPDRLARLFGASESLRERVALTLNPVDEWIQDRFVEEARRELGTRVFSAERARGRAMSLEEAVAYALGRPGS